ncbi:hypothetical protein OG783_23720 [Streptomyces jietaisiensis]|uniref:hypothetical protein n=1 Tax=Streptomyces griseoaurantiacus TaxID=68213 RepID=UPI003249F117
MPIPGNGGLPTLGIHPLQTLARGTDSRNTTKIIALVILVCVINGDSLTSILQQATWLVVSVIALVCVQAIVGYLSWRPVKVTCRP